MTARGGTDRLAAYTPRLAVDWIADQPEVVHRSVSGTAVFADISGFTTLTERLAAAGKSGAEEMGDLLNAAFEQLLTAAYDYGANLIKWGGDAVLLLFDGTDHPLRATRAGYEMQQVMRRIGRIDTSRGVVRLGMSIGVHSGEFDFMLVGHHHRELIVTGPAATQTAHMEKIASRGQVVLSPDTAGHLPYRCVGAEVETTGWLLARPPEIEPSPNRTPKRSGVDIGQLFCTPLREHLASGADEHEHRAIAVGFIEFSGTDALVAEHGVAALTDAVEYLMNAVQDAAHDNGVTILATDVAEDGGKIILTAGAPVATGDDESRVLAAVRRVVHPGGRLELRGGVTCGSVFAGDYGPFYRRTYSIAGDIVNLAARLMAKAGPGQVLATPLVVQRSRTQYETTALEPFAVKGKKQLVEALVVGDPRREVEGRTASRLPLLGRDRELNLLLRRVESAVVGFGGVVELVAPPGMGKSRLLEELVLRAGVRSLWFDGDIYSRSVPYHPMHAVFRQTLALPANVSDDVVIATLSDLVAGSAPHLRPWLPLLGIVAGVDIASTAEVDVLDPGVRRARLEAVTSEFLGQLLSSPTVIVVNDVQFMDEATVSLVSKLAADAESRPWLIVAARRTGVAESLALGSDADRIELQPLDASATEQLLAASLADSPLPPHRMRQLIERAGGHPLFLTMLAGAALDGADIDQLPPTVEALIAAQIDRLPSGSRRWLRTAAVLGMAFDPQWLRDLLVDSDLAAHSWTGLDEFIALHIDQRLHFAHHLIRLTAYEGLPFRRRIELHARAAQVLESTLGARSEHAAALLSMHCLRGERFDAAWRYSLIAAERARDQYAMIEAAECYERALHAGARLHELTALDRADVWEALADVNLALGESDGIDRALRQGRLAAKADPVRYARLCLKTAEHRVQAGRFVTALSWVTRGRGAVGGLSSPEALAVRSSLAACGARTRQYQGSYRTAMVWAERAVQEARTAGGLAQLAEARGIRSCLRALSGMPWDEVEIAETLALFEEVGSMREKSWAANTIGMCAYFAGRWDEARMYYDEAEQSSYKMGDDYGAAVSAANRAEVLVQQRRVPDAIEVLDPVLRILIAAKAGTYVTFALTLRARADALAGDYPAALERLGQARELAMEMGETDNVLSIEALAVECLVRAGEPGDALRLADEALSQAAAAVDEITALPALRRTRGAALIVLGQPEAGRQAMREALQLAQDRFNSFEIHECLDSLVEWWPPTGADEDLQVLAWSSARGELAAHLGIVELART